ncbi:unnamed protein product, partial [Owenia fusiformis]
MPQTDKYKAIYPYTPSNEGEIQLQVEDIITDIKELNNGWAIGNNLTTKSTGIFPMQYLERLPDTGSIISGSARSSPTPSGVSSIHTPKVSKNNVERLPMHQNGSVRSGKPLQHRESILSHASNISVDSWVESSGDEKDGVTNDVMSTNGSKRNSRKRPQLAVKPNILRTESMNSNMTTPVLPARASNINTLPSADAKAVSEAGDISSVENELYTIDDINDELYATATYPNGNTPKDALSINGPSEYQNSDDMVKKGNKKETKSKLGNIFKRRSKPSTEDANGNMEISMLDINKSQEALTKPEKKQTKLRKNLIKVLHVTLMTSAGVLLSLFLFLWMYFGLDYGWLPALVTSLLVAIPLATGLVLCVYCKCTFALFFPSLCTLRSICAILCIITGIILSGPIMNIVQNHHLATMCVHQLEHANGQLHSHHAEVYADQASQIELMLQGNLNNTMQRLEHTVGTLISVNNTVAQWFQQAVLNPATTSQAHTRCSQLLKTAASQCSWGIKVATSSCERAVMSLQEKLITSSILFACNAANKSLLGQVRKKLSLTAKDICSPITTVTDCNVLLEPDEICTEFDSVEAVLARTIDSLGNTSYLLRHYFKIEQTAPQGTTAHVSKHVAPTYTNPEDAATFTDNIVLALDIITKLLSLVIIVLVYDAYEYMISYLSKPYFDNKYIMKEFKSLDRKMDGEGKAVVLPFTARENKTNIDPNTRKYFIPSIRNLMIGLAIISLHALIAITAFIFDHVYYMSFIHLEDVSPNMQESTTDGIAIAQSMDNTAINSTEGGIVVDGRALWCNELIPGGEKNLTLVTISYVILVIALLIQGYAILLKQIIMAYFFPKVAEDRASFLFQDILTKRSEYRATLRHTVHNNCAQANMQDKVKIGDILARKVTCIRILLRK